MVEIYHIPALLEETIQGLNIKPNGVYVDLTFGGGGHSRAILKGLDKGTLIAFDQDPDSLENLIDDPRFLFAKGNFKYLKRFLTYYNQPKVDGILADLGVSFHHFDDDRRGFSFRFEAPLDMRMNQKASLTAFQVINEYSEEDLSNLFFLYGELRNSRKIAHTIVQARNEKNIKTTGELLELITPLAGAKYIEHKFFAQVFQALRIEVNQEMQTLAEMLSQTLDALNVGGRIAILTYHSLEDRIIKNFLKTGNIEGKSEQDVFGNSNTPFRLINRKVITPSKEEVLSNNRARSAKTKNSRKD